MLMGPHACMHETYLKHIPHCVTTLLQAIPTLMWESVTEAAKHIGGLNLSGVYEGGWGATGWILKDTVAESVGCIWGGGGDWMDTRRHWG